MSREATVVEIDTETRLAALRRTYIGKLPSKVDALVELWRGDGSRDDLARLAHQLAGTSGSYGLMDVSEASRAVLNAATDPSRAASDVTEALEALTTAATRASSD